MIPVPDIVEDAVVGAMDQNCEVPHIPSESVFRNSVGSVPCFTIKAAWRRSLEKKEE
jgi:hypothetical protein